ncbi:hypothetical protein QYM36_005514 [Artemia franciscana]|uniref:Ig-like domain-containing protein n=1 Tax=Artemia franciscana TaxID=6661 RepID=A0AA88HZM4_ARTSF|nr:hypothetical protein QYM36_005514 [Artemia franciscana]
MKLTEQIDRNSGAFSGHVNQESFIEVDISDCSRATVPEVSATELDVVDDQTSAERRNTEQHPKRKKETYIDRKKKHAARQEYTAQKTQKVIPAKEGKQISSIDNLRIIRNGTITFKPFSPRDFRPDVHATTLRCEASNTFGKIWSRPIKIAGIIDEDHRATVEDARVYLGNDGILQCNMHQKLSELVVVSSWLIDNSINVYPSPDFGEFKIYIFSTNHSIYVDITVFGASKKL